MEELTYDRAKAVAYAERWALSRNPRYYDFEDIGGDCTNFASQCIYAGAGVMNWTPAGITSTRPAAPRPGRAWNTCTASS